MVEQQAQHTMGLSEGYVPSRLDSRLSEDGVLQNLTWNDTRSRIQVRWEGNVRPTKQLSCNMFPKFANMALMVALSFPYPSLVQVVPRVVWEWDDATWVMAASFIIFTMQTGCVGSDSERPTATALELIILVLIATSMND